VNTGGSGTSFATAPVISGTAPISLANAQITVYTPGGGSSGTVVTLNGSATGAQFVADINQQLAGTGVTADINASSGALEFQGGAFEISANGAAANLVGTVANPISNNSMYQGEVGGVATSETFQASTAEQNLVFTVNGENTTVSLAAGLTVQQEVDAVNSAMNGQGIYALYDPAGANAVDFSGTSQFGLSAAAGAGTGAIAAPVTLTSSVVSAAGNPEQNATSAVTAVGNALTILGLVQGTVGAGENKLQYAINLASSQITNFSAAESSIRDADVATEAANLSKAQVLQQASIAAMAQANAAPQAVLKLLQ